VGEKALVDREGEAGADSDKREGECERLWNTKIEGERERGWGRERERGWDRKKERDGSFVPEAPAYIL